METLASQIRLWNSPLLVFNEVCNVMLSVLECLGIFQYVLVYLGMFRNLLECFGIFQNVLVYFKMFQDVAECFRMFCNSSVCFDIFWNV